MKIKLFAALLTGIVMNTAIATPITDMHTVTVGDKEWAQVDLFTHLSWQAINLRCPAQNHGVCSEESELADWAMSGWTWAAVEDVVELFSIVTNGLFDDTPGTLSEAGAEWGPAFFDDDDGFGFNPILSSDTYSEARGLTRNRIFPAQGQPRGITPVLWHATPEGQPTSSLASILSDQSAFTASSSVGAWFYRPVAVPAPAPLPLLGVALLATLISRQCRRGRVPSPDG